MNSRFILQSLIIILSLSCLSTGVQAQRKRGYKPDTKPCRISESKHMVVGFFSAGKLTGEAADLEPELKDRIVYGFGLSYEHYLRPKIGIGFEGKVLWKSVPGDYYGSLRATNLGLSGIYRFRPTLRRTFYLKGGLGYSTGSVSVSAGSRKGAGRRTHARLGIGLLSYTSGATNTRLELSYNILFYDSSSTGDLGGWGPFDINYIGVDFGIGLPL